MAAKALTFNVVREARSCAARYGRVATRHGVIDTPVFMPVGTLGVVKGLDPRDLDALGARICLANAYHLMLRPGAEAIAALGGLHAFSGFGGAILADSGGYQIYSLESLRHLGDDAVTFRSHIDGSLHELTPERLVTVQEQLAPDIAMVLDECPPADADRATVETAVRRTTAWAKRAIAARRDDGPAWFGITQGALFDDLRRAHVREIAALPFDGFAIGGVSVGESPAGVARIVALSAPLLPRDKPRYLMGVGTPADLVRGVAAGVDMFDCVMPTRNARNGNLFTSRGRVVIKNSQHRQSGAPLDPACACYTCTHFSRGFLRHLFVTKEMTYSRLATLHNLTFYLGLMDRMRAAIAADCFDSEELLAAVEPGAAAAQ